MKVLQGTEVSTNALIVEFYAFCVCVRLGHLAPRLGLRKMSQIDRIKDLNVNHGSDQAFTSLFRHQFHVDWTILEGHKSHTKVESCKGRDVVSLVTSFCSAGLGRRRRGTAGNALSMAV